MKYINLLCVAAISMAAASCVSEMPEATSSLTEEYYNRHFIYNHGELDTQHTWTYAQRAYASINVPDELAESVDGLKVSIYTDQPSEDGCRLLAHGPLSQNVIGFDYILGHNNVYVEVTDESDRVMYNTDIEIDNSVININLPTMLTPGATSLAANRMGGAPDDINGITWILAAEDIQFYSTFDFNDIVLGLCYAAGDETMTVYPLACGTELMAMVYIDDVELGEIHEMFGLTDTTPLNHQQFGGVGQPITVTVPATYSISESMGMFKVMIGDKPDPIEAPTAGTVPQMLVLPHTWQWPSEGVSIGVAYPDFHWWCSDKTLHEWLNTPEGSVVSHNL